MSNKNSCDSPELTNCSKGGQFEFLPVTLESAGAAFSASLRVGARAAIEVGKGLSLDELLDLPADMEIGGHSIPDYRLGGGIEVGVYANVAEFRTTVTANFEDDAECELEVAQEYSFVLGATAGAQVTVGTVAYGPAVESTTAIFTTTMASACALKPTPTVASIATSAADRKRDSEDTSLTTTVLSTTVIQTVMQCPPTITAQCPVSEQTTTTSKYTTSTTLTGSEEELDSITTYPSPTIAPITFGAKAQTLAPISGSPTSYTATPTPTGVVDQAVEAVREHEKIAIGVGVGVGVPLLTALLAIIL